MALQQLNIRISDEEHQHLESLASQTEGILTKQAVARLLIQHSIVTGWQPLTGDPVPQTMGEPAARRASSSKEEKNTNTLSIKSKSAKKEIPFELEEHSEQIAEFMRVKKGSHGATAWNLLLGELEKIRAKYGSAVVAQQLQLAINGKWQSVQLSRYEQFLPKAASPAQGKGGSNLQRLPNGEVDWNAYQDVSFFK